MTPKHSSNTHTPIAIIGIGCFFPKASGVKEYWRLLYHGIDAISDIPESHWSTTDYYDPDSKKPDHVYCNKGAFLSPVDFDPVAFGIPPALLEATDTSQLFGLLAARQALEDAGYGENGRPFGRERASVILGVTGTQELVIPLGARLGHPKWRKALEESGITGKTADSIMEKIADQYVAWQENSFPGLLGNVVAGRIANRLGLGGTNCVVDAACASSMGAIHMAVLELLAGKSDMVLTGGVDTINDIFMHTCFSQTQILSPTGDIRPFSANADGTLLGEGVGIVVLKRLTDAERANDRIYAVIRGIGSASDGRSRSIYAPRKEGQLKALRTAYAAAEIDPDTVELIEAHGTGTRVGDQTEVAALTAFFDANKNGNKKRALGSVKSMIGHTKAAAGTAGMIKAALALYHKNLPPTLKADPPDPGLGLDDSSIYLNTAARPWFRTVNHRRRAGVSAFGFGGSNFHVILEEPQTNKSMIAWDGSVEIIALGEDSKEALTAELDRWHQAAQDGLSSQQFARMTMESRKNFNSQKEHRLLVVFDQTDPETTDLPARLAAAKTIMAENDNAQAWRKDDIFYGSKQAPGKLAFLFPGQGSQYVNMAKDLAALFPQAMVALEQLNQSNSWKPLPTEVIYPMVTASDRKGKMAQESALRSTDIAQPAIGAVSLGMLQVLTLFGLKPDATAGHSYGELPALYAAGWINREDLFSASITRGRLMAEAGAKSDGDPGTMLAVKAPLADIDQLVADAHTDIVLANRNSPNQGVLSGSTTAIDAAAKICKAKKIKAVRLPVAAAFHSYLVADAQIPFQEALKTVDFAPTAIPVMSNTTGNAYSTDSAKARKQLGCQLANPVNFVQNIETLFSQGVATFVEIGPKRVLSGLVGAILNERAHHTVAVDRSAGRRFGILDLAATLSHLAALGHNVDLTPWETPPPETKEPMMKVPICGANYRKPEVKKGATTAKTDIARQPAAQHQQTTASEPAVSFNAGNPPSSPSASPEVGNRPELTAVVQEGLKSIQAMQQQTARAHEKFLESQAEASRVLEQLIHSIGQPAPAGIKSSEAAAETPLPIMPQQAVVPQPELRPADSPQIQSAAPKEESPLVEKPTLPAPPLQEQSAPTVTAQELTPTLLEVVSSLTGYPVEMLNIDMDIETDLGIDSIKRVEILSTLEERLPGLSEVVPDQMARFKTLRQMIAQLNATEEKLLEKSKPVVPPTPGPTKQSTAGNETPDDLQDLVLEIVSNLTGYPTDMLNLDQQLETDLGIDSIKRVEILSALEEQVPALPSIDPETAATLKTLGEMIAHLSPLGGTENAEAGVLPPNDMEEGPLETSSRLPRYDLELETRRLSDGKALNWPSQQQIAVVDDGSQLSEAVVAALNQEGIPATLVSTEIEVIHNKIESIGGLILIAPEDVSSQTLRNFLMLTKELGGDLQRTGKRHPAVFATVSRLDGGFGLLSPGDISPLQGAMAAMSKTARLEWPDVTCTAIDVAPLSNPGQVAQFIVNIITHSDNHVWPEWGFHPELPAGQAYTPTLELDEIEPGQLALNDQDVVVASGGAKGITAKCVTLLAKSSNAIFYLLGRSPAPQPEPQWLKTLTAENEIKAAILKHEFKNKALTPNELEAAYQRHMANREILNTLSSLTSLAGGAKVFYKSVDILDAHVTSKAVSAIRKAHGKITALIHGAGVLADHPIIQKTTQQFDHVFHTKVTGLKNLLAAIGEDPLRHLTLFSSVSARMGNAGQIDYAMANEVLNKMAQKVAALKPDCRVKSINWGPWDSGMVTEALKRTFLQRGIELIPAFAGAQSMITEMAGGRGIEVVVGNGLLDSAHPVKKKDDTPSLSLVYDRQIDLEHYPVLNAHKINGSPVVPFALMTEWMSHGALLENPGLKIHGLDEIHLLKGIRLENKGKQLRFLTGKAKQKDHLIEVHVEIRNGETDDREVIHTRGRAILSSTLAAPPAYHIPEALLKAPPYARSAESIYNEILFYGRTLQGIVEVNCLNASGMVAELKSAPPPSQWIKEPLRSRWLADPLVLDAAFQMASIWCFENYQMVSLPSYTHRYRQYTSRFPQDGILAILEVRAAKQNRIIADITYLDRQNRVVGQIKGYEAMMEASLVRAATPEKYN